MARFAGPAVALVREVPESFPECLRTDWSVGIDIGAARRQHAGYVAVLRSLGVRVQVVAADPGYPDCCFIEDVAVILDRSAVSTCPGAVSRRGEPAAVADVLGGGSAARVVHRMEAPATLDGGDVLRVDGRLFVGVSTRTNAEGVELLGRWAALEGIDVVPLEVRGGLHLKSACTLASATLLLYDRRAIDDPALSAFRAAGLECVPVDEPAGANVLAIGSSVLVSAAATRTAARLSGVGLDVRLVDVGEFHKGDGALTCLSLRLGPPGAWST